MARAKVRALRERAVLDGEPLARPQANGPQLGTAAEVERIVAMAVNVRMEDIAAQLRSLQQQVNANFDVVLSEARRSVHALSGDLAAPSAAWQTKCGWRFANSPGFRLGSSACLPLPESWAKCARCFPRGSE